MNPFESLGDFEPGPVGDFETGPPPHEPRPRRQVIARGLVGLAMVALPLVLASLAVPFSIGTFAGVAVALELYLAAAYYVRPRPADPTMGWRRTFQNPFRFTDDLDWMLWLMRTVLWPGRFASTAIVDLLRRPSSPTVEG